MICETNDSRITDAYNRMPQTGLIRRWSSILLTANGSGVFAAGPHRLFTAKQDTSPASGSTVQGYASALGVHRTNMEDDGKFDFDCLIRAIGVRLVLGAGLEEVPRFLELLQSANMLSVRKDKKTDVPVGKLFNFLMGPDALRSIAREPASSAARTTIVMPGSSSWTQLHLLDEGVKLEAGKSFSVDLAFPDTLATGTSTAFTLEVFVEMGLQNLDEFGPRPKG